MAIAINSSNVTLDFSGHRLAASVASSTSTGVALATNNNNIENVTIRNGTIFGFGTGIFLAGTVNGTTSSDHVVEGIRITEFLLDGIYLGEATGCLISNNFASGGTAGIVNLGGNNRISHNQVVKCADGIQTGGGGSYLEDNFVSQCTTGFICGPNDKLRFNTTTNCTTPFNGGTLITDDNN